MTHRRRAGIGVLLALALFVASVPICPCVPEATEADHSCCAPSLGLTAGHGECCPPAPELTGAQADSPALAGLADAGPAPELAPIAAEQRSFGASAPAPSPPSILRI